MDHAAIIVEYETGAKMSFDFCLFGANAGPQSRRMVIIGSEGVMTPEEGKVAIRKRSGKGVRYIEVERRRTQGCSGRGQRRFRAGQ